MVLSDMGAEVLRIERTANVRPGDARYDLLSRGRRSIAVDLKQPDGVATVLRLCERADGLLEGFRPGVMERLGLGPDVCLARNPRLVYGRMTGFGQTGPLAQAAGHDINYIALAGALAPIGRKGAAPTPPLNLVGDFGGGGLLLAFGMVCALLERVTSGKGQVVDAAMVDGAAALMTVFHGAQQSGFWNDARGTNMLDSGSHFYDAYETADGEFVAIGAIEPQFYAELLKRTGVAAESLPPQLDRARWPEAKAAFEKLFKTRTREEWCELLEGSDACFAPVLTPREALAHPHLAARGVYAERDGVLQAAPAPRFSATPSAIPGAVPARGEHGAAILREAGLDDAAIARLLGR